MTQAIFNRRSTASQVTAGINLSGYNIVLTGVSSGLGAETLKVLTTQGAHVIALARSLESAEQACAQVKGKTTPLACDLSNLNAVAQCAAHIERFNIPIHRLICNAGIMALPELEISYGVEKQFLTNHLGHYLLIKRLIPQLTAANNARIVILSSMGHQQAPKQGIDFDNLDGSQGYNAWEFYGQSKLANILTAKALSKRFSSQGIMANAVHPGVIRTNLGRHTSGFFSACISFFATFFERTIEQGAATQCFVAVRPELEGVSGEYFADCKIAKPSPNAMDEKLADRLWEYSNESIKSYL